MKIALLTLGTRGYVQPYAVLVQALKQRGHQVTLSTARNFKQLVKSYDIEFVPVEADFQEVLNSDEGKKMIKGNPFTIKKDLGVCAWWTVICSKSSLTSHCKTLVVTQKCKPGLK